MHWSLAPLTVALVACSPPPVLPTGGVDASDLDGDGACEAAPAQTLLHQAASDELAEAILKASGARTLRWGGPDTVFTMDYREDRVNVIYDADGTITRIYCG